MNNKFISLILLLVMICTFLVPNTSGYNMQLWINGPPVVVTGETYSIGFTIPPWMVGQYGAVWVGFYEGWGLADKVLYYTTDSTSMYITVDYTIPLDRPTGGSYPLMAVWYQGGSSSNYLSLTVTDPLSVELVNPSDGGAMPAGEYSVSANVYDTSPIEKVKFYVDNVEIATVSSSPYATTYTVPQNGAGSHVFKAVAYDTDGHSATDTASVIYDTVNPTVYLNNPGDISGDFTLTATASDNIEVDRVVFKVGDLTVGTDNDGSDGWSITTSTKLIPDGTHTLQATAYDTAGNSYSDEVENISSIHYCGETLSLGASTYYTPFWLDVIGVDIAHQRGCYGANSVVVLIGSGFTSGWSNVFYSSSIDSTNSRSFYYDGNQVQVSTDWDADTNGHDTLIAEMLIGYKKSSTEYVLGVVPMAKVVVLQSSTFQSAIGALEYARALKSSVYSDKKMIINTAFGGDPGDMYTPFENALRVTYNAGIRIVNSAGNDGGSATYPATSGYVYSVGSASWTGSISSYYMDVTEDTSQYQLEFSSWSNSGGNAQTTVIGDDLLVVNPFGGGDTSIIDGTSFAAPQVAGVFALIASRYGFFYKDVRYGALYDSNYMDSDWGSGLVQVDQVLMFST
ncbi:MAG: S8 family serine peptidase [Candidatus Heimdallarchaeota archaeon]|nr:S8 family serine peptidase [Candidatus Heimdallarchaeota archaeon]